MCKIHYYLKLGYIIKYHNLFCVCHILKIQRKKTTLCRILCLLKLNIKIFHQENPLGVAISLDGNDVAFFSSANSEAWLVFEFARKKKPNRCIGCACEVFHVLFVRLVSFSVFLGSFLNLIILFSFEHNSTSLLQTAFSFLLSTFN